MSLLFLAGCLWRAQAPVPEHPDLDEVSRGVVDEDPALIAAALRPFLVEERGLHGQEAMRWATVRAQANGLRSATLRSERSRAYAQLVVSCSFCHQGQEAPSVAPVGHGAGIRALEQGVIYGSPVRATQGREALAEAPDLTDSNERFSQLGGRIAAAKEPAQQARFLATLYGECVRCHGARSPLKVSR